MSGFFNWIWNHYTFLYKKVNSEQILQRCICVVMYLCGQSKISQILQWILKHYLRQEHSDHRSKQTPRQCGDAPVAHRPNYWFAALPLATTTSCICMALVSTIRCKDKHPVAAHYGNESSSLFSKIHGNCLSVHNLKSYFDYLFYRNIKVWIVYKHFFLTEAFIRHAWNLKIWQIISVFTASGNDKCIFAD